MLISRLMRETRSNSTVGVSTSAYDDELPTSSDLTMPVAVSPFMLLHVDVEVRGRHRYQRYERRRNRIIFVDCRDVGTLEHSMQRDRVCGSASE